MILQVFSVRDSKGGFYHPPFYKNNVQEAQRDVALSARKEESMIHQFPEDFDLFHLGEYDNATGLITPLKTPEHVVKAVHLLQPHRGNPSASDSALKSV